MRINIQAAATRGQTPFANREVTIEKDGDNVFLAFPQASGVVSNDSAVAIGDGILETAGFAAPESNDNIPAGWALTAHDGGYVVSDESGVVRGMFKPTTTYIST